MTFFLYLRLVLLEATQKKDKKRTIGWMKSRAASNRTAAAATATATATKASDHYNNEDTKYRKRQRQKKQEHFYICIICTTLMIVTVILILFLYYLLWNNAHDDYTTVTTTTTRLTTSPTTRLARPFYNTVRNVLSSNTNPSTSTSTKEERYMWKLLEEFDRTIRSNLPTSNEWYNKDSIFDMLQTTSSESEGRGEQQRSLSGKFSQHGPFFRVSHKKKWKNRMSTLQEEMEWRIEYQKLLQQQKQQQQQQQQQTPLRVDYTDPSRYVYPSKLYEPPLPDDDDNNIYPPLQPLGSLLQRWPQNSIDDPPSPIQETLQHFDYNNPEDMDIAFKFREQSLPFKLTNVPELFTAN
jgi:hypothetical protein